MKGINKMYATILAGAGRILMSMVLPLLTEKVIKSLAIIALEKVAKKTENEWDDQLVQTVKQAWSEDKDAK